MVRGDSVLAAYIVVSTLMVLVPLLLGIIMIRQRSSGSHQSLLSPLHRLPCEMLIPVKGVFPDCEHILNSFPLQDHPSYRLVFIVESEEDPIVPLVDELCRRHAHVCKVVSGIAEKCSQKNHNLIEGLRHLREDTGVVVFCDATNEMPSGWLGHFTAPIDAGQSRVVTTHRCFDPIPQTMGGLCQTVYGLVIFILQTLQPMPWGGGTAITRDLVEELNIAGEWMDSVNDDLVLGNVLRNHRVGIHVDVENRLRTPLIDHSLKAFFTFLDRQILNPRFTNFFLWLGLVAVTLNVTTSTAVISGLLTRSVLTGRMGGLEWMASAMLLAIIIFCMTMRTLGFRRISLLKWLPACLLTLVLSAFVSARSIFRRRISWHGRVYHVLPGGAVDHVDDSDSQRAPGLMRKGK